ncbi:hypothetical protein WS83_07185 [Burkholderia sp. MSMB2042]|nr:hypothetical protein WS78_23600 [Burkholderia savannae]KVG38225.1 hypothetical protein WS77_21325 [Burkholderia sp. MSMB0265]KVG81310.1 hypothetical protein WS81_11630 [Burkholderia sp. MSMB2040]KVG91825.1 hypothetical protein WS82_13580 [Burkholderia sp. MSMB2041]KVG94298.1 hypothetical protein WS83_07185 [Burkholderia sp. MSMB2042]KVK81806.1 hypothetical protein WS91_10445 [Burkholderia sp. MSMB1498]
MIGDREGDRTAAHDRREERARRSACSSIAARRRAAFPIAVRGWSVASGDERVRDARWRCATQR